MSTEQITPAEAFGLIGHETRIEILMALMDVDGAGFEEATLSFSELFDRVDIDDSGQLNYHLSQLQDHFVEKVDDGYRFRHAGRKVVWAVKAGTFTADPNQTFEAPGTCYECGEDALQARTGNHWIRIDCTACDTLHTANPFSYGGLSNRSPGEVLEAFDRVVQERVSLATDGICVECTGKMSSTVKEETPEEWGVDTVAVFQCSHCGYWLTVPFGMLLFENPRVERFYRDHNNDLDERPYWDIPICVNDDLATVTSVDPWQIEISTSVGGDNLRATLDDQGQLVNISIDYWPRQNGSI